VSKIFVRRASQDQCWTAKILARHGLPHADRCLPCDQERQSNTPPLGQQLLLPPTLAQGACVAWFNGCSTPPQLPFPGVVARCPNHVPILLLKRVLIPQGLSSAFGASRCRCFWLGQHHYRVICMWLFVSPTSLSASRCVLEPETSYSCSTLLSMKNTQALCIRGKKASQTRLCANIFASLG
jgi:hypothetical protein